ncbi:hypothetical protein U9M48_030857 [Paspalum notatum var. saurae]|uniref:CBS domain-containing protein n=1 Tax=Paspalum notatum var. saurae TaxID=547442 RepID=A0AAQ3X3Q7_PASNO
MAMAPSPSAHAPAVLPVPLPPPPRAVAARARPVPVHPPALRARRGAALVASAALDDLHLLAIDEYPDGVLSGEWPENFSFLSYADLRAYLESQIVTSDQSDDDDGDDWSVGWQMSPGAKLGDVMSRPVQVATPGQRLAEVDAFFAARQYSGLPVVDEEGRCVGVVSKKDRAKAPQGICGLQAIDVFPFFVVMAQMESTVGEVMSSPAITLTPEKTVLEAAALMLKEKVHRIPVVNDQKQVIGIVTRTDVFQALEANSKA